MSAPYAPTPAPDRAAAGEPPRPAGRWEWAAYPGQDPQWFWFPDPQPADPQSADPRPAATRERPAVWPDLRARARRLGFLLLVLGLVCVGVITYDELRGGPSAQQLALQIDDGPAGRESGADGTGAEGDPGAGGPLGDGTGDEILDELADTLRDRAQALTDAVAAGDAATALEYVEPGCKDRIGGELTAAIEAGAGAFEGISVQVASVVVTRTEGKVAYRLQGTPNEGAGEVNVGSQELPEQWVHLDGHWFRAIPECGL